MKPTLMLLPGLMCDVRVWQPQIDALSDAWDCRVPDYDFADDLGTMADFVLSEAPDSFALAGHSMGGRVALEVMRRAPERVLRLALLDTGYQALADGEAGEREVAGRMRLVELAQREGTTVMGQDWVQGMVHPDRLGDQALINTIVEMIGSKTVATFERQIQALIQRPDATEVLEAIRCPTTFICGSHDSWSPLQQHQQMADQVRHSRVVAIEAAGHMSTMERPEAMNEAFWQWLS